MEHTEELPDTREALYARGHELLRVLTPLSEQFKSAVKKKEKLRIRKKMTPSYQMLQDVKRKIKDLEQSATEVDHNAGSPTNDNQEEAPAVRPESGSSAVPPKPDFADASAEISLLPWILNFKVTPKEPKEASATDHAVLRFVADGKVHCFGLRDEHTKGPVIQRSMDIALALFQLAVMVLIVGIDIAADILAWLAEVVRKA